MKRDPVRARFKRLEDGDIVIHSIHCGRRSKPCPGLLGYTPVTSRDPMVSEQRSGESAVWKVEHPKGLYWDKASNAYRVIKRRYAPRRDVPDDLVRRHHTHQMPGLLLDYEEEQRWIRELKRDEPDARRAVHPNFPDLPTRIVCPVPSCGMVNIVEPPDGMPGEKTEHAKERARQIEEWLDQLPE